MYKILLVEDEVLVREAIAENMVWKDIDAELVATCGNGKEAIEVMETCKPDIVLTDICMPYVDGMQLSKFIYEQYPETRIIIFSGYDEFEYAKEALQYKVEEYLLKPITAYELKEVLQGIINKIENERQQKAAIKKIKENYYRHRTTICAQVLNDLLLGNRDQEEYIEELREAEIDLNKNFFKVAFIDVAMEDIPKFLVKSNSKQNYLVSFAIYNVAQEIIEREQIGIAFRQQNNRTVIIFQSNVEQKLEKEVEHICEEIQQHIKSFLGCDTIIGLGSCVDTLSKIYASYQEAIDAASYSYLYGYEGIISKKKLLEDKIYVDISTDIEALILQVKKHSKEGLEKALEALLVKISKARLQKKDVLLIMQKLILESNELLEVAGIEKQKDWDKEWLIRCEEQNHANKAMVVIKAYLNEIMEEIYASKEDTGKKQTLLALDYIDKNYSDSELTLQKICTYLCISPSYFSAIFKKQTGETFIEVLTRKRIQQAKSMLRNTNLKSYEVAEKVGFSDAHYFSQIFKKHEGKTPKKYAQESRNEEVI